MNPNNSNYGNRPQRTPNYQFNLNHPQNPNFPQNSNSPQNSNFQSNPNFQQNSNSPQNPNFHQNFEQNPNRQNTNIAFDPNMLNNPQIQALFQAFVLQSQQPSNFETPPHTPVNLSSPMSQYMDQNPTTPGGDGSNNRIPIGDYYQTQQLGDDDDAYDDDDEDEADQGGKGKNKILKERWGHDEDIALVSGYLNCGGDPLVGTDQSKAKLWKEIKRIYDVEVVKKPSLIHPRTMKSIKAHWRTINRLVTLWVSQLGEAERMKSSGMAITDVEAKAHELYKQKQNNKAFKLYHCWMGMRHLSRWQPGYDSTVVSQSSSKRSSDEVVSVRPDGQKKAKAQRKMKGVATSLDDFNNTLSEMQGERITIRKNIEEMMDYQKQRDEKKMRFKMYQLLMTKPSLDAVEFEYYEKLREEFMK